MPRSDHEARITPSVLDRLLDFDPRSPSEGQKSRSQTLHELKASVGRDLEWLLNTRRLAFELTDDLYEANRSVVAYPYQRGPGAIACFSAASYTGQSRRVAV